MTPPVSVPIRVDAPTASGPVRLNGACTMVILGGSGDLTRRKLMPALFHLMLNGLLPAEFRILAVGRDDLGDAEFAAAMREAIAQGDEGLALHLDRWNEFAPRLGWVRGDLGATETYRAVGQRLDQFEHTTQGATGRLFYLAIPPSVYETAIRQLSESGIAPRTDDPNNPSWVRVVIEKPFGHSLESAQLLNRVVNQAFAEHQVYRIDHYLGKETVQNLLVFRFANSIFEPLWNRNHIHHVQITAAETLGIEHRGGYYEEAGVLRDMFQNHLLQLLTLTAMEPPATFRADAVRDEKAKVLSSIRPFTTRQDLAEWTVRGQYGPGVIDGQRVPGYREEEKVAPDSVTPTYAAVRFMVDNWRWQGVPFFLRSGKRLARRVTEIAIQFREPPHRLFPSQQRNTAITPNLLAIRIQPEEGLSLSFEIKVPGIGVRMTSARMDFAYGSAFGGADNSAYETLLLDCMMGDTTLFIRNDATEAAWRVVDPIIAGWQGEPPSDLPNYIAGEWGPTAADALIARAGASWRRP